MNEVNGKESISCITIGLLLLGLIPLGYLSLMFAPNPQGWTAHPMHISQYVGVSNPIGYTPDQIRVAYNLPAIGGEGATIAIVIAYHTPDIETNFNVFSTRFGLPINDTNTANLIVHQMQPNIEVKPEWSVEACLDTQWAHAIAPQSKILLVETLNPDDASLLEAVNYAASYPGVVAVSLSWGGEEFSWESRYESYFNKAGIQFFAASGDDGLKVHWPACSAYVISVGGTTLNLNSEGKLLYETAWKNSSGGISKYLTIPKYQTDFGLDYSYRAVPDVSYNADIATGFAVYDDGWWKVGGTSAGSPQWAAIYALSRSATNNNLYNSAKNSYSSYFNDITLGANYKDNTNEGYDLVTGLGSPLTVNFGVQFSIEPKSGPGQSPITLSGMNFIGKSVNLSYRNPQNGTWMNIANNIATIDGDFSFQTEAPDLLAFNPQGDNPQTQKDLIFRVIDSENGKSYYASFTQYSRGLSQIGAAYAQGLYGNNTDLTSNVLVQRGDIIDIAGRWFRPGTATILLNGIPIGSTFIDGKGSFTVALTVLENTPIGGNVLTINDGVVSLCLNITCTPKTFSNYDYLWHTTDFIIPLSSETTINETFYRINNGAILNLTANGQPTITTEGAQNTLEYWSTWNLTPNTTIELPHVTLSGIKLDKTAPQAIITINPGGNSENVYLYIFATDEISGIAQMRFSLDGTDWSTWEPYTTSKVLSFKNNSQTQTVFSQFKDNAGLNITITSTTSLLIQPTQSPSPAVILTETQSNNTATPPVSPTPTMTIQPPITQAIPTPSIPEFSLLLVLLTFIIMSLPVAIALKHKHKSKR